MALHLKHSANSRLSKIQIRQTSSDRHFKIIGFNHAKRPFASSVSATRFKSHFISVPVPENQYPLQETLDEIRDRD